MVFGLAALLLLVAYTGLGTMRETRELREQLVTLSDNQHKSDELLDGIANDLYTSSILFRDLLIESSGPVADEYQKELRGKRTEMMMRVRDSARPKSTGEPGSVRLHNAVVEYWRVLGTYMDADNRARVSDARMIRDQLRTQRLRVASVSAEISTLEADSRLAERKALEAAVGERSGALRNNFLMALGVGSTALAVAWWRLSWLRRKGRSVGQDHGRG